MTIGTFTKTPIDHEYQDILGKIVNDIRGKELEILDQFAKAWLADMHLTEPKHLIGLIRNLQLNQQQVNEDGKIGYKYWYSLRDAE